MDYKITSNKRSVIISDSARSSDAENKFMFLFPDEPILDICRAETYVPKIVKMDYDYEQDSYKQKTSRIVSMSRQVSGTLI